jgi:hypothetical protein
MLVCESLISKECTISPKTYSVWLGNDFSILNIDSIDGTQSRSVRRKELSNDGNRFGGVDSQSRSEEVGDTLDYNDEFEFWESLVERNYLVCMD